MDTHSSLHRLSIYNFITIINQWTVTVQVFTRLLQTIWLVSTFLDHKPEVNASLCDPFPHSPSTLICNLSELCYVWTVWYAPLGTAQCWTFSHSAPSTDCTFPPFTTTGLCSINWLYLPTLHTYRTLLHQLTVPSHPSQLQDSAPSTDCTFPPLITIGPCTINWLYLPTTHIYRTLHHQLTVPAHPSQL